LGLSVFAASKLGLVSRSTLIRLGVSEPSGRTLGHLDELCSWEPGSAAAVLFGGEPAAREEDALPRPAYDPDADDDYGCLIRAVEARLRELGMSKVAFARESGLSRSTLVTLGRRGYRPTPRTLELLDTYLLWVRGSALAVLKGGRPVSDVARIAAL